MILWEKPGRENTKKTISIALDTARKLNINDIVVASNTGETIKEFNNTGLNIICVTHQVGFVRPGEDEMSSETRKYLNNQGIKILTTTHLFRGLDRALSKAAGGWYPAEITSNVLRIFGQGTKVAVEIAVMALDAGLVPYGKEIISIGGTTRGADTAIIIIPAHSHDFFQTKVREIICKPR
ncbi:MAG: hypothetical protein HY934_03820 [Candidatus Firestonebacteria bacterium]|nr:hypothetical protein [Candidatus Firestonebacteria bacterium]